MKRTGFSGPTWSSSDCDATLSLLALMNAGYYDERRLTKWEVDWLPGYEVPSLCASATVPRPESRWTCTAR
jgi:hypothetical protein